MINNIKQTYLMCALIAAIGFISVMLAQGTDVLAYGALCMSLIAMLLALKLREMKK